MKRKKSVIAIPFVLIFGLIIIIDGCVIIRTELDNPYVLTVRWDGTVLVKDPISGELPAQVVDTKGVEVSVAVFDERGHPVIPEEYEWYLNGDLFVTGKANVFIPHDPESVHVGNLLDILVSKGNIIS